MKCKLLSLALVVSLLIGMVALPVAAEEIVTEPIIANGGFEEVTEDNGTVGWSGGMVLESNEAQGNLSHGGNKYMYIATNGLIYSAPFALEAEKDYILTLYSRTSIANSAQIDIRFRANGDTFDKSIPDQYVPGTHLVQDNFGSAHSAPAEGEADGRFRWEKQQFCFTTPPLTDSAFFYIKNQGNDEYLCIDDVSIALSGDAPNLIQNGRFRAFINDGERPSGYVGKNSYSAQPTYSVDANGDTVVKVTEAGKYFGIFGMSLKAGRYKLSFDYRNDGSASYVPQIYMKASYGTWTEGYRTALQNTYWKQAWQRYEYYFTVTGNYVVLSDVRILPGYTTASGPSFFKNISLWKDEANVEYAKDQRALASNAQYGYSTEWYMPIDAISDVEAVSGVHTIKTKAHYIPTGTGDESFVLIDSVFKVFDDGREVLSDIAFKNGSTTGGIVGSANSSIKVPALTGEEDYTYEIRSFIWSGTSTLRPVAKKTVLTY